MLRSSTPPVTILRQYPSRASTFFSFTTRKPEVLATPTLFRSLSRNYSEAAYAPPLRCPWAHIERVQVLARVSQTFPSTATSALSQAWCKGNCRANRLRGSRGGTINFWTRSMRLLINRTQCLYPDTAPLTEHFLSTSLRYHSTPRFNSNTPRAFYTANFKRRGVI